MQPLKTISEGSLNIFLKKIVDFICMFKKQIKFANLIAKNSKTQVVIVKNETELRKYFKKNLISNEIIIGVSNTPPTIIIPSFYYNYYTNTDIQALINFSDIFQLDGITR